MSNPNYIAGRNFEYEVMAHYRKLGYYCFRSAGSHSEADIICLKQRVTDWDEYYMPLVIQCKRYTGSKPKPSESFKEFKIVVGKKLWVTKHKGASFFEIEEVE